MGHDPIYRESAHKVATYLAKQGHHLVYGGGNVGLMGVVADAFLAQGAEVYGVMPEHLVEQEIAHPGLTELQVVGDMRTRKAAMAERADAFVALPGGAGTLEEIFEVWTLTQLGQHQKPCAFYDVAGYYQKLFEMFEHMHSAGFIKAPYIDMLIRCAQPEALLQSLEHYVPPKHKWA